MLCYVPGTVLGFGETKIGKTWSMVKGILVCLVNKQSNELIHPFYENISYTKRKVPFLGVA